MTDLATLKAEGQVSADRAELLEANIAAGQCAIVDGWCLTHQIEADFGHYLDTRPKEHNGHNPVSGIAYND